jgi:hypothetical protein
MATPSPDFFSGSTVAERLVVTGVLRNGRRFKPMVYMNTPLGRMTAFGINLWRGSIWGERSNGKRFLIKRVYN